MASKRLNKDKRPSKRLPAEHSVELQVLNRFIGTWDSEVTNIAMDEVTKTIKKRSWPKKGNLRCQSDGSNESLFIMTYEPNNK